MIWGDIALKRGYFEGMRDFDPPAEVAAYQGPLFVAHGTRDVDVLPHAADKFLDAHQGPQEAFLADMDHSFNAIQGAQMLDQLLDRTVVFYRQAGLF
jgi:hypothetical protein